MSKSANMELVRAEIAKMTSEELKQMVPWHNQQLTRISQQATMKFSVGDAVYFNTPKTDTGVVVGTVTKINKKTIRVVTPSGKQWNVSASLLKSSESLKVPA